MNHYELTCLISSALSEGEVQEISEKIKKFISDESGSLEKTILPPKKKIIYFPKKAKNIFLVVSSFRLEPVKIENLKKRIESENQILRFIILSKKEYKENQAKGRLAKKIIDKNKNSISREKNAKVKLNEIDKKIEEILSND